MYKIRLACAGDIGKLVKCYVDIWESLGEWLPESVINPELDDLLKRETGERLKQQVEDVNVIFLVAAAYLLAIKRRPKEIMEAVTLP